MGGTIEYEVGEGIGGPIVVVFYCGGGMSGVYCGRRRLGGTVRLVLFYAWPFSRMLSVVFEQLNELHPLC